ncbi:PH domain-containing protein [Methanobrevibacter filiformis]|nr:PH domain-containing protein [Methanobrevibacter filiformis]
MNTDWIFARELNSYFDLGMGLIFFIIILWIIWIFFSWSQIEYTVTDSRIISKSGVIRRKSNYLSFDHIQDISTSQGLIDRLFSIGNIFICSAYDDGKIILKNIRSPGDVEEIIFHEMSKFHERMSYQHNPQNQISRYNNSQYNDSQYTNSYSDSNNINNNQQNNQQNQHYEEYINDRGDYNHIQNNNYNPSMKSYTKSPDYPINHYHDNSGNFNHENSEDTQYHSNQQNKRFNLNNQYNSNLNNQYNQQENNTNNNTNNFQEHNIPNNHYNENQDLEYSSINKSKFKHPAFEGIGGLESKNSFNNNYNNYANSDNNKSNNYHNQNNSNFNEPTSNGNSNNNINEEISEKENISILDRHSKKFKR